MLAIMEAIKELTEAQNRIDAGFPVPNVLICLNNAKSWLNAAIANENKLYEGKI